MEVFKLRKAVLYQQLIILIICFLAGVGCFYLFSPAEIKEFIGFVDGRVLNPQQTTNQQTILLAFGSFFVVFLLGTNPFFIQIAKILVAARICFFGLSSIILLQSNEEVLFYGAWWFPFQFVYCLVSLMFIYRLQQLLGTKKKRNQNRLIQLMPYFVLYGIIVIGELFVLRYFIV